MRGQALRFTDIQRIEIDEQHFFEASELFDLRKDINRPLLELIPVH